VKDGHHHAQPVGVRDMDVHRVIVRAGIGKLRAIPVWRKVMQLGGRVGSWKIRLDRELNVESLTIDLLDPPGAGSTNFVRD
jgi:hypothetical protein